MLLSVSRSLLLAAFATLVGCSTGANMAPQNFTAEVDTETEKRRASCMAQHSSFSQRPLNFSAAALEQAYIYCVNRENLFYAVKPQPVEPDTW